MQCWLKMKPDDFVLSEEYDQHCHVKRNDLQAEHSVTITCRYNMESMSDAIIVLSLLRSDDAVVMQSSLRNRRH